MGYRVLLVDDEYMILEGLQYIIPWAELGFEIVKKARSGTEALAFLEKETVDLMITDITMPDMSGIELVDEAARLGYHFLTVFLTGYQEFAYVKEGLRLGAKAYLVKPVNRAELLEVVQKSFAELEENKRQRQQAYLVVENNIRRWINDELSEVEFEALLDVLKLPDEGPYTAVKLYGTVPTLQKIIDLTEQKGQHLFILETAGPDDYLLLVFQGSKAHLLAFLQLVKALVASDLELYLGETVADWENVYESYEKILQVEALKRFYPDLLPKNEAGKTVMAGDGELSFFAFNKALMIGDEGTIRTELANIFAELTQKRLPPDYARSLTFLLMADIARQYPTGSQALYEETLAKIRLQENVVQLRALVEEVLAQVAQAGSEKPYSELTQNVVAVVKRDYQQELTIKMVADALHLNSGYLGQLFKKETHLSFSQYLNHVRIKKAQQLLLHTTLNVNEIADETGYKNTNYFSKMFKKLNGITPKEFRDQFVNSYSEMAQNDL